MTSANEEWGEAGDDVILLAKKHMLVFCAAKSSIALHPW